MIFDRIMLPAQGRNEDYKFAQTGSITLVASAGSSGGGTPAPSWLENVIKIDTESGAPAVQDWHVKGNLIIEGQVNQWLAQQLVVDDARIQVNRKQGGAVADSGLVIFDKDTSSEVSALVYDVNGIWKAGGDRLFTEAYNPKLGGLPAASYLRSDVTDQFKNIYTGSYQWTSKVNGIQFGIDGVSGGLAFYDGVNPNSASIFRDTDEFFYMGVRSGNLLDGIVLNKDGWVGFGIKPTQRLHVAGNGLFTGNVTAGGNVQGAGTFVSGFAGSNWRLEAGTENHLTLDRLTVRGRMDIYELVVNQIRGTNGALWVSDSAKVASVSGNRLTIDTGGSTSFVPFVVNDLLRCQRWNGNNVKYYVVRVTAVGSNYIDVTLVNGSSPREAGDHLIRMGNTENTGRQGAIYLTSSDSNAPYMDVLDGVDSASFAGKTKVRIGRLDGITDPDLGTLSGYGLYTENGYFKGKITVTGGNAATKEDVDAVQIGGRNLFFKSGFSSGTSGNYITGWAMYGATLLQIEEDKPFAAPGVNAISWVISSAVSNGGYYQRFRSPDGISITDYFKAGEQYTVSAWIKASSAANIRIHAEGIATESITATTEWEKYSLTFTGDGTRHTIAFYGYTQGVRYYLCMPKLELGNRATDWTPAPEDVPSALDYLATAIQDGKTEMEGGLITTNVLMVKDTNGAVRGGMSGLKSDNVGFWTGGTYQNAVAGSANVIFRKDGSFSLAGGKISGTASGNVTIDGSLITKHITTNYIEGLELNFRKGKIGGFSIGATDLVGSDLKIAPSKLSFTSGGTEIGSLDYGNNSIRLMTANAYAGFQSYFYLGAGTSQNYKGATLYSGSIVLAAVNPEALFTISAANQINLTTQPSGNRIIQLTGQVRIVGLRKSDESYIPGLQSGDLYCDTKGFVKVY